MERTLYLPQKYRVLLGAGSSGFCTIWSDPALVLTQSPELTRSAAIIGTLYSREGVNIILRNLALNPDIGHIFLWGNGALSRTPFGLVGKELIQQLWGRGFDTEGKITGTNFLLHPEFNPEVIRTILANVTLVDLSEEPLAEAVAAVAETPSRKPYMEPQAFPEHQRAEGEPFPSEGIGFVVRGPKIVDAWLRVVDRVMRYGVVKETEYGNRQRELVGVTWVVANETTGAPFLPDWPEEIMKLTGASREAIERYYPEFMSPELPAGTAYTYGQRLWAYGREQGSSRSVSQIEKIITHFKASAVTRRAVATTWDQFVDADPRTENPPCFVMMQAIQTDGKLHLLATFRSHDIFKAAIANAFGLRRLQEYLAQETGFAVGTLAIVSNSAHIYEEDWDQATKLIRCAIWEREVPLVFDQERDADPRGVVLIRLDGDTIVADFATPDGATLLTFEGRTARQIYKKMAFLDLLCRSDHLMDIGAELQKAEVARDLGIAYVQDQPLKFPLKR